MCDCPCKKSSSSDCVKQSLPKQQSLDTPSPQDLLHQLKKEQDLLHQLKKEQNALYYDIHDNPVNQAPESHIYKLTELVTHVRTMQYVQPMSSLFLEFTPRTNYLFIIHSNDQLGHCRAPTPELKTILARLHSSFIPFAMHVNMVGNLNECYVELTEQQERYLKLTPSAYTLRTIPPPPEFFTAELAKLTHYYTATPLVITAGEFIEDELEDSMPPDDHELAEITHE
jgi:hypothetical protein